MHHLDYDWPHHLPDDNRFFESHHEFINEPLQFIEPQGIFGTRKEYKIPFIDDFNHNNNRGELLLPLNDNNNFINHTSYSLNDLNSNYSSLNGSVINSPIIDNFNFINPIYNKEEDIQLKKFGCSYCTKTFTRKHDLTRHTKIHTNDRKFACDGCDKRFYRKDLWRRHMETNKCFKKVKVFETLFKSHHHK